MRPALYLSLAWALIAMSGPAAAQVEAPPPDLVLQLSKVVRWSGVVTSLFVIAGAWMILRVQTVLVERFSQQFSSRRLTLQKLSTIFQFVLYIATAVIVMLISLRIDQRVLAVIGGTVAVALGFAIKDLVASFIAGIIIMIDRPFQVGDRVTFGGEYGDIIAIGLRSVRMRTLDDNIVTIPNNKFLSDLSSSGNYGELDMQVAMNFVIGLDQDVVKARDIVKQAGLTSRYVFLSKPIQVLVKQVTEGNLVAVQLKLKAYVLDTKYEKAFETDVNLRVLEAFAKEGIRPPMVLFRFADGGGVASVPTDAA